MTPLSIFPVLKTFLLLSVIEITEIPGQYNDCLSVSKLFLGLKAVLILRSFSLLFLIRVNSVSIPAPRLPTILVKISASVISILSTLVIISPGSIPY